MSYRALSPSLGDQEFPMKQLLFLLAVGGVADKKGTCPSPGVCARWVCGHRCGDGCLGSSLESSGDQYHLYHLFAVYFGVCLMSVLLQSRTLEGANIFWFPN